MRTLALAVGGALLLAAAPARADEGQVTFSQMNVLRCAESGDCEWKLSCGVQGQPETEMFSGKKARTKYSVDVKKSIEVKAFPATLQCTVWEDDGFLGESWEKVGTGTVTLPAGGDYRLDIGNTEQGTVRVRMVADSLQFGMAAPAPAPAAAPAAKPNARAPKPPAPLQFVGSFSAQKEGQAVLVGFEWSQFKAKVDELAGQGIQLFAVSSFEQGGKRLWNGVFRPSPEEMALLSDMDWDKFADVYKRVTGGRKRLIDMEVYQTGGKMQFAALYRELGEGHSLWVGQPRKDFTEKVRDLAGLKGQQVLDVEVYRSGSSVLYAGPFREMGAPTELWTALDQAAFQARLNGLRGKDRQVVDVETYKDGNKRFFDAIVRAGNTGDAVVGLSQADFGRRWKELAGQGLRLLTVDVYQD